MKEVKFLDVNKDIINAIFLLEGSDEEIREGINGILEEKGQKLVKKEKKAKKAKEKTYNIEDEVKPSPKRAKVKFLFSNKDYSK